MNTGKESIIRALGRDLRVSRFSLPILDKFVEWIKEQLPPQPPKEIWDALPKEEQVARYKEQERITNQLRNPSLQSPIVVEYQSTERGAAKFLQLFLEEHQPDITMAQAFDIVLEIGAEEMSRAIAKAHGDVLGNGEMPALAAGRQASLSTGTKSSAT